MTVSQGLLIACGAVPNGAICLPSALQFHGIGMQLPSQVWIAFDRRSRQPSLNHPALRVLRFTGAAIAEGVGLLRREGVHGSRRWHHEDAGGLLEVLEQDRARSCVKRPARFDFGHPPAEQSPKSDEDLRARMI